MNATHKCPEAQAPLAYSSRFQDPSSVLAYEESEYGARSYSSCIWNLQQPWLQSLLGEEYRRRAGKIRLLDFACGTGRILAFVEPLVADCEGVDISPAMVDVARKKCLRTRFSVGDPLAEPRMLTPPYDVITCFRFLLNVEPQLRRDALCLLRGAIREPDGLLLINMHGNSGSLRHPAIVWKRWRRKHAAAAQSDLMLNEMSAAETRDLLEAAGFEIVQQLGFGLVPPTLYRTPLRRAAYALDRWAAGRSWVANRAVDLLFVCKPRR